MISCGYNCCHTRSNGNAINFYCISINTIFRGIPNIWTNCWRVRAFNTLQDFSNNEDLRDLSTKYPLINSIYSKVDNLITQLDISSPFTSEEASSNLIKRILIKKFSEKPRFGGYVANVSENGSINYIEITEEKIKSLDSTKVLENTFINQGSIIINAEELFK